MLRQRPQALRCKIRYFHTSRSAHLDFSSLTLPVHDAIQAAHTVTGLSWHYLIPLTTFGLRAFITMPIAILNRKRNQKQAELQPILSASGPIIRAKLAQAASAGGVNGVVLTPEQIQVLAVKERRKRRIELFKRHGVQAWKSMVFVPSVQMPLWISMSWVVRSMCGYQQSNIPQEPGFSQDAFLWYPDLVSADPYSVLPLVIGFASLANVEWNTINMLNQSPTGRSTPVQRIVTNLSRVGIMFFMTATFQAPSAVCLYWATSATFSLLQNIAFDYFFPIQRFKNEKPAIGSALPSSNTVETKYIV